MATPNTPKLKFNEFLDKKMEYRSGGKGQWKHIKKVWEGLKLKMDTWAIEETRRVQLNIYFNWSKYTYIFTKTYNT